MPKNKYFYGIGFAVNTRYPLEYKIDVSAYPIMTYIKRGQPYYT